MTTNIVPIQFYTSEEMRDQLRLLSKHDNRSVSNYLRQLVSKDIDRGKRDGIIKGTNK